MCCILPSSSGKIPLSLPSGVLHCTQAEGLHCVGSLEGCPVHCL